MTVAIPSSPAIFCAHGVVDIIRAHALASYPQEGCGVLIGPDGSAGRAAVEIVEAVAIENVAPGAKDDRYELDPRAYAALEQRLRQTAGLSVVGFFHSHPDGQAVPSKVDLEAARGLFEFARTYYVYAIQALAGGTCGEVWFWRLKGDAKSFIEMTVARAPASQAQL